MKTNESRKSPRFRAVILAGGSGERFWPLSTSEKPKQFLDFFGGASLIRQSVSRLKGLVASEDTFVVTSRDLVAITRRELPEIPRENIVGEPMRRDTGAAVALGVGIAGDGIVGFFPSDQLVAKPAAFRAAVRKAIACARRGDAIVTLGIKPDHPATGFGYVDPKTGAFAEKPDLKTAKSYLRRGYLWNAGMFIAAAATFRRAFAAQAPALLPLAEGEASSPRSLAKFYESLPKISFDYAVMEKYRPVAVVPGDFGWDDVGSLASFDRYYPHDGAGNVSDGACNIVDGANNICVARAANIALLGVSNLVVVTAGDSVLVADKSRLGEMKRLFRK